MSIPKPPKAPTYVCATFVETRSPKWKYHTSIGHAKNAARTHCHYNDVSIYEYVDGELTLKYFIEQRHWQDRSPFPWENEPVVKIKEISDRMRELREATARAEKTIRDAAEELERLKAEKEELEQD